MDGVQKANSGHPGMPMGMAPAAYVVWTKFMRHNPKNPNWANRDRFVLSAGHGSMLLYSLLYLTGYDDYTLDQLKQFRQWGSLTPGHPETELSDAIETTTGPLGQGFANGVGMAIGADYLAAYFNREGAELFDYYIYAIVSDGDLMEGVASEAASLAGHLKLGRLIYLYDDNEISIDGNTNLAFTEDRAKRFEAYGWHVQRVDGNDIFGPRDESLVFSDAIENVPEEYRQVGTSILMENDRGETRSFLVTHLDDERLTVDGNNPLCGREVVFALEILTVRDATEDETRAGGAIPRSAEVDPTLLRSV